MSRGLVSGFVASSRDFPDRPALEVDGSTLTFAELKRAAATVAAALEQHGLEEEPPLTAVLGHRSKGAFVGVLASILRGHGFVPLNPTFPPSRTRLMLVRSGCRAIVVDTASASQLPQVLAGLEDRRLLIIIPDEADTRALRSLFRTHRFVSAGEHEVVEDWDPPVVDSEAISYLLFTSGSTGAPKGVGVTHANVRAFLDYVVPLYDICPEDRFSQTFDMTFDLSIFDMFAAWECGACVCCPSTRDLRRPDRFIQDAALTVWFSVPSAAIVMRRLGMLKENRFRTLRLSLFCGEPLPADVATAWANAAPRSVVENLYGPTELTIACTRYRWTHASKRDVHLGLVPIGTPFPGMEPLIVDDMLRPSAPGEAGELLMTGPQMTPGYWNDVERTADAYVVPPGDRRRFYRTGDRVHSANPLGPLRYLGRVDHQIKVRGHRVELGEVEAVVREESGLQGVVAIGWPRTDSGASGLEVFLEGTTVDQEELRRRIGMRLPEYMVPRRVHVLKRLPLNSNGKYDRNALLASLAEQR